MSARKVKTEIYTYNFVGVVEFTEDPKRIGRVKVRIERLHGRKDDEKHIPTEDLPWCDTTSYGKSFGYPPVGKVVKVAFENDDIYKPSVVGDVHYEINLQEKLDTLDDAKYAEFYAMTYDDKHQYFHDKDEGVVFDYVKSNINMRTNGDIRVNLRDNSSSLYLGTEDASQQAVLGNHFMDWMDELVQNLLGTNAGPYNGNMGSPVIPNPKMLEVLNKYLAMRETFLSDHVYIVDDNQVKSQDREFDTSQKGDNYNDEKFEKINKPKVSGHQAEERPPVGGNGENSTAPANNYSNNLTSSKLPEDATPDEKLRNIKPFENGDVENGGIPIEQMTSNKRLKTQFNDERQYLLDEPSKALDTFLDAYDLEKESSWGNIEVTKGYQNNERQENNRKQFPQTSPLAKNDPFGNGNQIELYWGVDRNDTELVSELKAYIRSNNLIPDAREETKALDWLVTNGKKYKWRLAGRTLTGTQQWWHWIYDSKVTNLI